MAHRPLNEVIYDVHIKQALRKLKQIETERELLKGHFSKVAKQYYIKVTDLKKAYKEHR